LRDPRALGALEDRVDIVGRPLLPVSDFSATVASRRITDAQLSDALLQSMKKLEVSTTQFPRRLPAN